MSTQSNTPDQISPATTPPKRGRPKKYATADEKKAASKEAFNRCYNDGKAYRELRILDKQDALLGMLTHLSIIYMRQNSLQLPDMDDANKLLLYEAIAKMKFKPNPNYTAPVASILPLPHIQ